MILITAAGGKVGQHLAEQLSKAHVPARAGFRTAEKAKAFSLPGVESVVIDLDSPASIASALKGVDKVFLVTLGAPTQVAQEGNVIREAKKAGVKHIVKLSAMAANEEKFSFARWNRAVEKELEASGIPWTHLRPNMFDQNILGMAGLIKDKGGFSSGPANIKTAPVDARDIAAAAKTVLTTDGHTGKAYAINGPEVLTHAQLADIIGKVIGKKVQYWDQPVAEWKKGLEGFGLPAWLVAGYVDMTEWLGTVTPTAVGDTEKLIGRKPTTYEKFITDNAAAFR